MSDAGSISAGMALFRVVAGEVQVLLGHLGGPYWASKDDGAWTFPKGLVDTGDSGLLAAAEREFAEELGSICPAGPTVELGSITTDGKTIVVFARRGDLDVSGPITSNTFAMQWPPRSGRMQEFAEIDRAGWFGLDDAARKLTKNQRGFVERLAQSVDNLALWREAELAAEAATWDTSAPRAAAADEIPTVDIGPWLQSRTRADLDGAALQLRRAGETVGFFQLVGHGVPAKVIDDAFTAAERFHSLPHDLRTSIDIDKPGAPGGVGYLPFGHRRLPKRAKGNLNEAFVIKVDPQLDLEANQWPDASVIPGFRAAVETYVGAITALARDLVTVYEAALELPSGWFDDAFAEPTWRLRLTHYPAVDARDADQFGIAPHVDTTFFTVLAQRGEGLVIHRPDGTGPGEWTWVPEVAGALVVNTGELLRTWSNDRFASVKHFANNNTSSLGVSRYSIPLFYNANADYVMECLPTCCDESNPARYPPVSYRTSQAAAQGE